MPLRQDYAFSGLNLFAPGMSYGTPEFLSNSAPAGPLNYEAGRFTAREEDFPVPVCGIWFNDSTSVSIFNPSPKGNTTAAETRDRRSTLVDCRLRFGMLGAYRLSFRFSGGESFHDYYTATWRWAWNELNPTLDMDVV